MFENAVYAEYKDGTAKRFKYDEYGRMSEVFSSTGEWRCYDYSNNKEVEVNDDGAWTILTWSKKCKCKVYYGNKENLGELRSIFDDMNDKAKNMKWRRIKK